MSLGPDEKKVKVYCKPISKRNDDMGFCFSQFVGSTTLAYEDLVSFQQIVTVWIKIFVYSDVVNDSISFRTSRSIPLIHLYVGFNGFVCRKRLKRKVVKQNLT